MKKRNLTTAEEDLLRQNGLLSLHKRVCLYSSCPEDYRQYVEHLVFPDETPLGPAVEENLEQKQEESSAGS